MIQVDQGITFAWSNICVSTRHETKTKTPKKCHGLFNKILIAFVLERRRWGSAVVS
jgi:hypothetical protein